MFDVNPNDLCFIVNNNIIEDNYFYVDGSKSSINCKLLYIYNNSYKEIYSIDFSVNNYYEFAGGDGSE